MTGQQLKNSILQMAVQGKLVPQDPNDEPASVLLERIRKEKEQLIKDGKIKKEKNPSYIFRGADNLPYEKVGKNELVCIADEVPFDILVWSGCDLVLVTTAAKASRRYRHRDCGCKFPWSIPHGTSPPEVLFPGSRSTADPHVLPAVPLLYLPWQAHRVFFR